MIQDIRIGFTAGSGVIGYAIRKLDTAFVDGKKVPSAINHVLLRILWKEGPDLIFQSHGKGGVGICYTSDLKRAISEGRVFRYAESSLNLVPAVMDMVESRTHLFTGAGYDQGMIALYFAAFKMGWRNAPAWDEDGRYTCNEAVLKVTDGAVSWATSVGKITPEPLFLAAMKCPSPVYFQNHPAFPIDFW